MLSAFLNCGGGGPPPIGVVGSCESVDEDKDRSIGVNCGGGPLLLAELPGRLPWLGGPFPLDALEGPPLGGGGVAEALTVPESLSFLLIHRFKSGS